MFGVYKKAIYSKRNMQLQFERVIYMYTNAFVCVYIQYPENFAFLTLRTLELFVHEVCKFLKK